MIKRKFITLLLLVSILLTCLSGCAKVVRTETTVVEATVVDTYHKAAWMQPIWNGKFFSYIFYSAEYKVTLQYENYKITVDDESLYRTYKDNIGAIVECNLVTTYYDDDTSKTELKWENNNQ
jgi:hypothetical protein